MRNAGGRAVACDSASPGTGFRKRRLLVPEGRPAPNFHADCARDGQDPAPHSRCGVSDRALGPVRVYRVLRPRAGTTIFRPNGSRYGNSARRVADPVRLLREACGVKPRVILWVLVLAGVGG